MWETAPSEVTCFPQFWFWDLKFRIWGLEIKHLYAPNFVGQGCFFLSLLSRNFGDQLSSNFHRVVILCICWDTPSKKTGLWQLPIVSIVFKTVTVSVIFNRDTSHLKLQVLNLRSFIYSVYTCLHNSNVFQQLWSISW